MYHSRHSASRKQQHIGSNQHYIMKTYHVFIASSLSFQKERDLMEKVLTERNNSELNIVVHRHEKNGDNDLAKGDTQEIIKSEIRQCDVIIFFAGNWYAPRPSESLMLPSKMHPTNISISIRIRHWNTPRKTGQTLLYGKTSMRNTCKSTWTTIPLSSGMRSSAIRWSS